MSDEDRCSECARPIRFVSIGTWNGARFPLDYTPSVAGEYAVLGPDTAAYIKPEDRGTRGKLYTDHRRTCPKRRSDPATDQPPLFTNVHIHCERCQSHRQLAPGADDARNGAEKFIEEHINCRGGKAS